MSRSDWLSRGGCLVMATAIWLWPVPEGLTPQAWHLFAIFAATIAAVASSTSVRPL